MTAIYDTMQYVRPDIQTVCLGQAASAAAVLLAAGTPGKRMALPNSRIIIHQPATEGGYGQGSDIEIQAREILRMRTQLEDMISRHSGRPIEQVRKDIDRDKILTAEEAKEYGLVDTILTSRKKGLLAANAGELSTCGSEVGRGSVPGRPLTHPFWGSENAPPPGNVGSVPLRWSDRRGDQTDGRSVRRSGPASRPMSAGRT